MATTFELTSISYFDTCQNDNNWRKVCGGGGPTITSHLILRMVGVNTDTAHGEKKRKIDQSQKTGEERLSIKQWGGHEKKTLM